MLLSGKEKDFGLSISRARKNYEQKDFFINSHECIPVSYPLCGICRTGRNPIDWDENGIGNEDDDGSDDTFSEDSLIIPDNEEKSSAPSDETSGGHESQTDIYETTAPREEAHSTDSVKVGTVVQCAG